jgi:hypothetical protein
VVSVEEVVVSVVVVVSVTELPSEAGSPVPEELVPAPVVISGEVVADSAGGVTTLTVVVLFPVGVLFVFFVCRLH